MYRGCRAFTLGTKSRGVTFLLIAVALLAPVVDAVVFDPLTQTGAGSDLPDLCLTPWALGTQPSLGPGREAGFLPTVTRLLPGDLLPFQPFIPPRS